MSWVGRRLPRYEDPVLLRGDGRYVADLARGALAMRFVRSPVARGIIRAIAAPPGARVITAADLADVKPLARACCGPTSSRSRSRCWPRAGSPVGEPIAAVIADSAAEAEDFAEQVEVEIDPEIAVVTFDQALAPRAPLVHDAAKNNTIIDTGLDTGDVGSAFAAAERIVEFTFVSRRQSAVPLETRGALAAYDPATGRITLSISAQAPHMVRTGVADALGMPGSELRVIAPDVGGGFGQKVPLIPEYVIAVWAARRFRCAVAWIEDRLENLTASFHARDQQLRLRGAFAADGKLLALDADILCNIGAYGNMPVTAALEPLMAMTELPVPTIWRAYRVRARGITTNTCPMAPYRGVSRPVITTAMERLMDTAATRLGLDPLEIRRRNLISSFPHHSLTGWCRMREPTARRWRTPLHRRCPRLSRSAEGRALRADISASAFRCSPSAPATAARLSPRGDGSDPGLRARRAGDGFLRGLSRRGSAPLPYGPRAEDDARA